MRRHCDGQDPNLVMCVNAKTGERYEIGDLPVTIEIVEKSCDCGLVFDDVRRSTVYPHTAI